ncbi:hypothetical protein [Lachnotalea glycerini]|uniref:hypothetical protein n=1 Tax=Lachnotalea glycerini TaxID=1763509 RepID=UPI0015F28BF3|nr:hypothetical protein [Lachnotalea glycerini]
MSESVQEKTLIVLNSYLDRVQEKLDDKTVSTDMVHEDIRIIHHIIKMMEEINKHPIP